jgi:hypothetical protein
MPTHTFRDFSSSRPVRAAPSPYVFNFEPACTAARNTCCALIRREKLSVRLRSEAGKYTHDSPPCFDRVSVLFWEGRSHLRGSSGQLHYAVGIGFIINSNSSLICWLRLGIIIHMKQCRDLDRVFENQRHSPLFVLW